MLKTLLKKQMLELNRGFFVNKKTGEGRSKISSMCFIFLYVVLMVAVLGGMFTYLSLSLCTPLHLAGLDWLYFALIGLIAIALGVFGSVFNTYASLYQAKDNDLMLSLPVPVRNILTVRLLGVYLMGLMFSAIVMLPAIVVYCVKISSSALSIVTPVILMLLVSIFVLSLSCILGWVIAKISNKLKSKSFISVLASLVFLIAYYVIYFRANTLLSSVITNGAAIGEKIRGAVYPLYIVGRAGSGDIGALALTAAVVLIIFAIVILVLVRSFLKIVTSSSASAKVQYKEKTAKIRSIGGALFHKELSRFTSSSTYMLNCALGTLILIVGAIFVIIKGNQLIGQFEAMFSSKSEVIPLIAAAAICILASMNDITAPSVSLEGKNIWLAQSLPITPWQALKAKLWLHLVLTEIPVLLCGACVALILKTTAVTTVLVIVFPLLFTLLSALFGLFINLKMPNLNWVSETAAVKQSIGVLIAMLGGWAYTVAFAAIFLLKAYSLGTELYLIICSAFTALLCVILMSWLKTRGGKRFASL